MHQKKDMEIVSIPFVNALREGFSALFG